MILNLMDRLISEELFHAISKLKAWKLCLKLHILMRKSTTGDLTFFQRTSNYLITFSYFLSEKDVDLQVKHFL